MLKPYFQKIVTLDPNAMFCEQHAQEGFHAIQGTFEETALQERFDLVLCSHVLYYSDPSEWNSFVEKLTRHRKPGGVVAIAMMSPLGEDAELVKRFRPNFKVHSGTLETLPVIQQSRKEVIHSHHEYVVDTYEEMLTLCRFLISEDAFTPEEYWSLTDKRREEIDALIRSEVDRMKRADGKFVMQWEQDLYLLRS